MYKKNFEILLEIGLTVKKGITRPFNENNI